MERFWEITITTNAYKFTYHSDQELHIAIAVTMKEAFKEFFHIPAAELRVENVRHTEIGKDEYEVSKCKSQG